MNLKASFNHAASNLARRIALHAGRISGVCFALGNGGLLLKDYIFDRKPELLEQSSGALFLAMNVCMFLYDERPKLKIAAGVLGILGATALGYSALGKEGVETQLLACATTAALSLSMIFEKGLNNLAKKAEKGGKGILKTIFTPLAKYPVATMAAIDLVFSSLQMTYTGLVRQDFGLALTTIPWIIGGTILMATDNNLKEAILRPKAPRMLS